MTAVVVAVLVGAGLVAVPARLEQPAWDPLAWWRRVQAARAADAQQFKLGLAATHRDVVHLRNETSQRATVSALRRMAVVQ